MSQTGVLILSSTDFTLHTKPSMSPPEFTITCHTKGGPATTVEWQNSTGYKIERDSDHETSQVIVDTLNSVYESRLRVRGKESGTYVCIIRYNQELYFPFEMYTVSKGVTVDGVYLCFVTSLIMLPIPLSQLQESPPTSLL